MEDIEAYLDKQIRKVPDFPKKGILFYDITSIMTNPEAFRFCIDKLVERYKDKDFDGIAAIESRGFIFAAPLAEKLGKPLVLIRKKGKLPGDTYCASYELEYGNAEIEVQKSDVHSGEKFLVIDDLIATGGTLNATRELLKMAGANVFEFAGIIGLPDLNYEKTLQPNVAYTMINYHGA